MECKGEELVPSRFLRFCTQLFRVCNTLNTAGRSWRAAVLFAIRGRPSDGP